MPPAEIPVNESVRNIMIIVHNDAVRDTIKEHCSYLKLNVVFAASNSDNPIVILNQLTQKGDLPELILIDIVMPKLDGYAFARMIRLVSLYDSIRLVALITEADDFNLDKLKAHGFNTFIFKPITLHGLSKVLIPTFNI